MKKKNLLWVLSITITIILSTTSLNISSAASTEPKIYIYDPDTQTNLSTASTGEDFTIEILVANVTQLMAFEFYLKWDTSVLDLVEMAEGPFLNSSGAYQSFMETVEPGDPNYPHSDSIYMAVTLVGPTRKTCASGSGVLATVTFRAKTAGISPLDLWGTILVNYDLKTPAHTVEDGYFSYPLPKIIVEPTEIINQTIQNFDINITIVDAENVYNWTLKLKWTSTLLDATDIVEGPFLKDEGPTDFENQTNQAGGFLYINNTLTDEPSDGVSGNGTLTTITFTVEAQGISSLDVYDSKLYKKDGTYIPHLPIDGYFSNVMRDVAITSVEVSSDTVAKGQSLNITVVAENQGQINETFTVTVYYDGDTVGSKSVTDLTPNNATTLTFTWNTQDVAEGSYTIKATASQVPGEADTTDNTLTASETVSVTGEQSGIPTTLLIGGVAVAALVAVLGLFFYRRSKSSP